MWVKSNYLDTPTSSSNKKYKYQWFNDYSYIFKNDEKKYTEILFEMVEQSEIISIENNKIVNVTKSTNQFVEFDANNNPVNSILTESIN